MQCTQSMYCTDLEILQWQFYRCFSWFYKALIWNVMHQCLDHIFYIPQLSTYCIKADSKVLLGLLIDWAWKLDTWIPETCITPTNACMATGCTKFVPGETLTPLEVSFVAGLSERLLPKYCCPLHCISRCAPNTCHVSLQFTCLLVAAQYGSELMDIRSTKKDPSPVKDGPITTAFKPHCPSLSLLSFCN